MGKTVTSSLFHFIFNDLLQGVCWPTKYHLLWNDDDNMKTDELQQLIYKVVQIWPGHMRLVYTEISPGHIWTTLYYLCHMFSQCTRSMSYPAPTYNAHLAAYPAHVYLEGWVCSCCHEMNRSEKYYCTCSTVVAGLTLWIQMWMEFKLWQEN
jgi:hypothetical protein